MTLIKNVGKTDGNIRLALGGLFVLLGIFGATTGAKVFLTLIGLLLLVTGKVRTCPAYMALKIDTNKP